LYGSDDLSAKIQLPSCRQYKLSDFLVVTPLNWDEILDKYDDENWAYPGMLRGRRCRAGDVNDIERSVGEEDKQGAEKGTEKGNRSKDGKGQGRMTVERNGNGKGKGMGDGIRNGIVKQTPGVDDISCAIALQLQKAMYEADCNSES
jgi:hypothetical protein